MGSSAGQNCRQKEKRRQALRANCGRKIYPIEKAPAAASVTVNSKTVTAGVLNAAIAKAGGSSSSVTTIVLGKSVKKISKGAFNNYRNVKTLVVKTKKLKKGKVKNSLKGSSITGIKVQIGKKNAGKKVKVSL